MFGPVSTTSCCGAPFEPHVVGHEGAAGEPLDHRMAHVGRGQLVAVVDVAAWCSCRRPRSRPARPARRAPPGPRAVSSTRGASAVDPRAQRLEELELALDGALVGAEHLLLVVLERRGDEALAAGDRLLADVVVGHRVEVGLRDLDVVAEHAVEADLQRLDAGARPLGGFELGDHLLAGAADPAQLVELGVDAVADHAAVAGQRRRLVDDRGLDGVTHVGEVVELRDEAGDQRRPALAEQQPHPRHRGQRRPQGHQVARARRRQRDPRHQPLEVEHRLQASRAACRARRRGTPAPRPRRGARESARA